MNHRANKPANFIYQAGSNKSKQDLSESWVPDTFSGIKCNDSSEEEHSQRANSKANQYGMGMAQKKER